MQKIINIAGRIEPTSPRRQKLQIVTGKDTDNRLSINEWNKLKPNYASVGRSGFVKGAILTRRAAFVMNFTEPSSLKC